MLGAVPLVPDPRAFLFTVLERALRRGFIHFPGELHVRTLLLVEPVGLNEVVPRSRKGPRCSQAESKQGSGKDEDHWLMLAAYWGTLMGFRFVLRTRNLASHPVVFTASGRSTLLRFYSS